jgi:phosphoglucomutase
LLVDGSRVVCRLSGTGTAGATLRVYLERYRDDEGRGDIGEVLAPLAEAAKELLCLREYCDREEPSIIT